MKGEAPDREVSLLILSGALVAWMFNPIVAAKLRYYDLRTSRLSRTWRVDFRIHGHVWPVVLSLFLTKVNPVNFPHPHSQPTPPSELIVVGEHRSDPLRLLLLGVDGHYYAYALPEGNPKPVELDDGWAVESPSTHDLFDESAALEGYNHGTHHEGPTDS